MKNIRVSYDNELQIGVFEAYDGEEYHLTYWTPEKEEAYHGAQSLFRDIINGDENVIDESLEAGLLVEEESRGTNEILRLKELCELSEAVINKL